ncbi:hypothetical protein [Comamonas serinivorans]|uniref:hypothetical protein n=1 Tax=Comamonas serinivorans TaxID=1082851 RepID=UPI0012F87949|nr:hypothetical protein [Comamonas serinivorans]
MTLSEFGVRDSFALGRDGETLSLYVAGIHLTEFDDRPYWPAFLTALRGTHRRLASGLNVGKHEQLLSGLSVEDAHWSLLDPNSTFDDLHSELRFANWGPTTDGHVCFLLPINGSLFVSCSEVGSLSVSTAPFQPHDSAVAISQFLAEAAQPFAPADGFAAR